MTRSQMPGCYQPGQFTPSRVLWTSPSLEWGLSVLSRLIGSVLICQAALAATWYVSPTGNDSNPGTATQPYRTVNRGVIQAAPGDTVDIPPGQFLGPIQLKEGVTLIARIPGQTVLRSPDAGVAVVARGIRSGRRLHLRPVGPPLPGGVTVPARPARAPDALRTSGVAGAMSGCKGVMPCADIRRARLARCV